MNKGRKHVLSLRALLLIALPAIVVSAGLGAAHRSDDYKYRVFCANGKIAVEQRTLEQEKNAQGSNVCQMAEFDSLSDADNYAERHGGKGGDCSCK